MRGGKENAAAGVCFPVMGTRMRFPGYPSNREADERTRTPLRAKAGEDKLFPVPLGLWEGVQVG